MKAFKTRCVRSKGGTKVEIWREPDWHVCKKKHLTSTSVFSHFGSNSTVRTKLKTEGRTDYHIEMRGRIYRRPENVHAPDKLLGRSSRRFVSHVFHSWEFLSRNICQKSRPVFPIGKIGPALAECATVKIRGSKKKNKIYRKEKMKRKSKGKKEKEN